MADFKVIETQEQLDAIIGERLKRQAKTYEDKFSNYLSPEDLNTQIEGYNTQIAELTSSLEAERQKNGAYDATIEDLNNKIKTYETNAVKTRITAEVGLPHEFANRLSGDTEEDIRKDAEFFKSVLTKGQQPAPLKSSEAVANKNDAEMRQMIKSLKGE